MARTQTDQDGQAAQSKARSPLSQTSSEQSDEGDLTKLVAQIKAAAAKKVKGRKKDLLRTIEARVAAEERKFHAECQRNYELVAQAGDEWTQILAVGEATHDDLLSQLQTIEDQMSDLKKDIQTQFVQYARHRIHEGDRLRTHMHASADEQEQTEGVTEGVQTD